MTLMGWGRRTRTRHKWIPDKPDGQRTEVPAHEVQTNDATYPIPHFYARKGAPVAPRLTNGPGEPAIILPHELLIYSCTDGNSLYAVRGGTAHDYRLTV